MLLYASVDGKAKIVHVTTGQVLKAVSEPGNQIFAADYRPDGKSFATAGSDRAVCPPREGRGRVVGGGMLRDRDSSSLFSLANLALARLLSNVPPSSLGGLSLPAHDCRSASTMRRPAARALR